MVFALNEEQKLEGSSSSNLFEMESHSGKDLGSKALIDNMMKQSFPVKQKPQKT